MTEFKIFEGYYDTETCRADTSCLYVFGDNLERTGRAGQATIRYESNAFGVATKALPSKESKAFFRDGNGEHLYVMMNDIIKLYQFAATNKYNIIYLPENGLGTGLSDLPKKAPGLFKLLTDLLYTKNGLEIKQ